MVVRRGSTVSWPDFFSQLFTQLFPGIARFSCPLILCLTLNFGRTMLASQRQNLLRGSSSLPVRVRSGVSDASYSACIALEDSSILRPGSLQIPQNFKGGWSNVKFFKDIPGLINLG